MAIELSDEDISIANAVSSLVHSTWIASKEVLAPNTDPRIFSVMLFRRLQSNYQGFLLLWRENLQTEADIVLRSGLEAAICIAANNVLRERFVRLAKEDVAATLKRQIKMWRDDGATDMVQLSEARLREIQKEIPRDVTPKTFDWKSLASIGGVPLLYTFHRSLSGASSHVSGLSLLHGVVGADMDGREEQEQLSEMARASHLMMMVGATLLGCKIHSAIVGRLDLESAADDLVARLDASSKRWAETI